MNKKKKKVQEQLQDVIVLTHIFGKKNIHLDHNTIAVGMSINIQ